MHKKMLNKAGSDVYELCWHFLNEQLFCSYPFFHDIFLLPPTLSLIPSLLSHETDLGFVVL
jgi:hypothetical protein